MMTCACACGGDDTMMRFACGGDDDMMLMLMNAKMVIAVIMILMLILSVSMCKNNTMSWILRCISHLQVFHKLGH